MLEHQPKSQQEPQVSLVKQAFPPLIRFIIVLRYFSRFAYCAAGQDIRDRISGAVEAFSRRNLTGGARQSSRNKISDDVPSSKDVLPNSERIRSSRDGDSSKRGATAGSRPGSSVEPTETRLARHVSSSGARISTTHRVQPQPSYDTKPLGFSRTTKGGHEDQLRSFEFLSIRK
ncbi:hypothetical protein HanOQP8_Chr15g0559121 [Helianthus annuus]|nr:hypothetical protein HanLR1_Chr15g0561361 [Helianthus annuus]KAJ0651265.1 hypothetical protein HanOQP8_Chr15g0559121 [Helianthus annuus]